MHTRIASGLGIALLVSGCGGDPGSVREPELPAPVACVGDELHLSIAVSVAVDEDSVFVADLDTAGETGVVVRTDKACNEVTRVVEGVLPRRIEVDGDFLYWVNENAVMRSAKDGSGVETVHEGTNIAPTSLAFDEAFIYLVENDDVLRIPKAGGAAESIAAPGCGTSGIAVDATHIYLSQNGCAGDVMRLPKGGGPLEIIAVTQWSLDIAVDDDHVYWVRHSWGSLSAWPKTGGVARVYSGVVHVPGVLAQSEDAIYYAGEFELGGFHRGGSEAWYKMAPAYDVAVQGGKLFAVGEDRLTILDEPPLVAAGFPAGEASLTVEWMAECHADSRISFLILGPTSQNTTVACDDMAVTFEGLAPGTYRFWAEHADSNVGFEGNPVEVSGDVKVGPIDLLPFD